MKKYRFFALITSIIFLLLALATKYYSGPYWQFSNAYLGDVFIVAVLYYWLAAIFPTLKPIMKALIIFAVALLVESFQASGIPASWNLPEPYVFVLGSQFDAKDFIYYTTGLVIAVLIDKKNPQK